MLLVKATKMGIKILLKTFYENARNSYSVIKLYKSPCSPRVYSAIAPSGMMSSNKTGHNYGIFFLLNNVPFPASFSLFSSLQ